MEAPAAQVRLCLARHGEVAHLARLDLDLALGVHRLPGLLQLEVRGGDAGGAIVQLVGQREGPSGLLFYDIHRCRVISRQKFLDINLQYRVFNLLLDLGRFGKFHHTVQLQRCK